MTKTVATRRKGLSQREEEYVETMAVMRCQSEVLDRLILDVYEQWRLERRQYEEGGGQDES